MEVTTIDFFTFLKYYWESLLVQFLQHLKIVLFSIPPSILLSVPIGFLIASKPKLTKATLYIASILMTIPSLALFGIMVVALAPLKMGVGLMPAVIAIIVYSLLPIIRNTVTALNQVSPRMIEAAKGMGLTKLQILFKIKLPLSIPVIMAGVRVAIVMGVGVATLASLVSAGGLGYFIFAGVARANFMMVSAGSVLVSILGILCNYLLMKLESFLTPRGLKIKDNNGDKN